MTKKISTLQHRELIKIDLVHGLDTLKQHEALKY